jgi:hypothetical protein
MAQVSLRRSGIVLLANAVMPEHVRVRFDAQLGLDSGSLDHARKNRPASMVRRVR